MNGEGVVEDRLLWTVPESVSEFFKGNKGNEGRSDKKK